MTGPNETRSDNHSAQAGRGLHGPSNELVENNSGATITALKVVKFNGIGTELPQIEVITDLADKARGVLPAAIANGEEGQITAMSYIVNVNTSAWAVGTQLYSNASGNLTQAETLIPIGEVLKQHITEGVIFIDVAIDGQKGDQGTPGDADLLIHLSTSSDGAAVSLDGFSANETPDTYFVNLDTGNMTITIPDADFETGVSWRFFKIGTAANDLIIKTVSGDLVGGEAEQRIALKDTGITIIDDTSEYQVVQDSRSPWTHDGHIESIDGATKDIIKPVLIANPDGGDITAVLPLPGDNSDSIFIVKNEGTSGNRVILSSTGGKTIDGVPSHVINDGGSLSVFADDDNDTYHIVQDTRARHRWFIVGGINSISANSVKTPSYGHTNATAPPRAMFNGRVKSFSANLTQVRTSGVANVILVIAGVAYNDPADIAVIDVTNSSYITKVLNTPIEFVAGDDIGGYSSTVGFAPTGSDLTLSIDVEIDK